MCRSCLDYLTAESTCLHMLLSMLQHYDHLMHEVLTYHNQSPCRLMTQTHRDGILAHS